MKLLFRFIIFGFVFIGLNLMSSPKIYAQSKSMRKIERRSKRSDGNMFNQTKSKKVRQAEKKAEAVKERQKDDYSDKRKKELKKRQDIQTPQTRERMKESKKQADQWNNQKRPSFFKRLFRRKP